MENKTHTHTQTKKPSSLITYAAFSSWRSNFPSISLSKIKKPNRSQALRSWQRATDSASFQTETVPKTVFWVPLGLRCLKKEIQGAWGWSRFSKIAQILTKWEGKGLWLRLRNFTGVLLLLQKFRLPQSCTLSHTQTYQIGQPCGTMGQLFLNTVNKSKRPFKKMVTATIRLSIITPGTF